MNNKNGFTLLELMITVAIIGILAAIAFPSYNSYVWKSREAEAKTLLMRNAQMVERYYTSNNSYSGWAIASGVSFYPESAGASDSSYYYFTYTASGTQAYDLVMAPGGKNTGPAVTKSTLKLKNTGEKCTASYGGSEDCNKPW